MAKNVTRSTVNEQQYSAPAFPKSGFNLTHRRYSSYILGRMHVSGSQWIMPGDKVSGKNDGNFTFKRIVTPMLSPVEVGQYNIFMPFRAVDRTFEKAFAPNKNNGMSASWHVPTVSTRYLVSKLVPTMSQYSGEDSLTYNGDVFLSMINSAKSTPDKTLAELAAEIVVDGDTTYNDYTKIMFGDGAHYGIISSFRNRLVYTFQASADKLYLDDVFEDLLKNFDLKVGTAANPLSSSTTISEFLYLLLDAYLTPWVGWYSYYGEFRYKYLRPKDIYRISHGDIGSDPITDFDGFFALFDDTPLCEYPLRIMYAIWYERFRNVDLEPVNANLPDWREFGSTSIFDLANGGNLCYLLYRPRPWYEDMFVTAQIDDLSRHVFAPVYNGENANVEGHVDDYNNFDSNLASSSADPVNGGSKPAIYTLTWYDQLSGVSKSINCPVPANINDVLSANDISSSDVYGLDLNSLRQSFQLERYLKRNYLFGDEYQDRMLAHYNSRVSDMRINRPEIVSMSLNQMNEGQEIANMSNDVMSAGERTATATAASNGDQYTFFAEEFGLLVNLITFMPLASYDGITPQLLSYKVADYPLPEFATNNEEFGRKMEIADSAISPILLTDYSDNRFMFGRYPAYHAWRQRVDEVGGDFLNELQDCTFRRFWGLNTPNSTPKLNYYFIHCRPSLGMFANTNTYDAQVYGDIIHECFVERVLPTPVEVI